ncbi:hypothetical protein E2P81_ATG04177 [Venturia nashicola]|uniref:Uncharacterized protein n=1 Tax=Venturia nashicola TaxID=86259 RepID=A0A4Z1PQ85_9PEZI|nr:hypothetical protein E6O75_ATG04277 [Venturia nashicola]TLD37365.1 hypothetical protein E2P81_ATG04177 [Venturia nashicola]
MKNSILSLLPLALASANPLQPRQEHGSHASNPIGPVLAALKGSGKPISASAMVDVLPKSKIAKVEEMQPTLKRPDAKRLVATFGPYTLVGKNEPRPKSMSNSLDPKGQAFMEVITSGLCEDCTVLTGKNSIRFEDGKEAGPADGVYVHHILSRNLDKPKNAPVNSCSNGGKESPLGFGSEFLAQGDDSLGSSVRFTSSDGSANTGFIISKGDRFTSQFDLVHYNEQNRTIFLAFDIEYVPKKVGMADAAALLLSVTGCVAERKERGGSLDNPIKLDANGVAVTDGPKFAVTNDTVLVASKGHLHDGGMKMIMLVNDKEVCESKAIYGKGGANNDETIESMTECPPGIKMKKGDNLSMKAVYDLKTHPIRNGGSHDSMGMADVMGMFYLTFANAS